MKTLMSIDLSTNCTGISLFNIDTKELVHYEHIRGKDVKDSSKLRGTLLKIKKMCQSIRVLVDNYQPTYIVIEEIAGSKNRLSQKTLDICHGILQIELFDKLDIVQYYDVTGATGWRTNLGLKLSEADKVQNKQAKELNKKIGKASQKLPILGPKHLACRFVNKQFGLKLDVEAHKYDADLADSISMGYAFLLFRLPKP